MERHNVIPITLGLAIVINVQQVCAQPLIGNDAPFNLRKNGFHLYRATASVGYSSLAGSLSFSTNPELLRGQYHAWASLALGYSHHGPKSETQITYTPSYSGAFGFGNLQSFNQALSLSFTGRLSSTWRVYFSGSGDDSTVEQFIFNPSALAQTASAAETFDQFAGAVTQGMTSGPGFVTPLQATVYGPRVLTFGADTGLVYKPSTRLGLTLNAGIFQSQTRNGGSHPDGYLIPKTRFERGSLSLSYALNPRNEIGAQISTMKTRSIAGDYEVSTFSGSLARKLGPHWFASVMAGVGAFTSLGLSRGLPEGISYLASGTLGYKTREHTWAGIYSRAVGDAYGLAAASTSAFSGSWSWRRPGLNWGLDAFGGEQRLTGGSFGRFSLWQASAGVTRILSRQSSLKVEYAYMIDSISPIQLYNNATAHAVRLTVSWIPFREVPPAR